MVSVNTHLIVASLLLLFMSGCQVNKKVSSTFSVVQIERELKSIAPVDLRSESLFYKSRKVKSSGTEMIAVLPGLAKLVNFGSYLSPAMAFELTDSTNVLVIESYVTSTPEGSLHLFYPVLSIFDKDLVFLGEVKPDYEFAFTDNVLKNRFTLPTGTHYVIAHTMPEFTGMSFSESKPEYSSDSNVNDYVQAVAIGVMTGTAVFNNKLSINYADFTISNFGHIKILNF